MIADLPKGLVQLGYGATFRERIADMLESIAMFDGFARRELELLADYLHAYEAPSGSVLLREGRRDGFLWLLVDGRLDVIKEAEGGKQRRLATVRAGKAIGEMSIIDEQPHSATVVVTTPATLLLLTKQSFERIGEEHARVGFRLLWKVAEVLSHRLRQTSGQLVDYL
jgi:CRP/FNR family cyclic AMP-dependent transcriptional regulator